MLAATAPGSEGNAPADQQLVAISIPRVAGGKEAMSEPKQDARADRLSELLGDRSEVEQRSMFGRPAFFAGGGMFACVDREGVAFRLPAARVVELLASPDARPFPPHRNPPMRGWVLIAHDEPQAYAALLPILLEALTYTVQLGADRGTSKARGRPGVRGRRAAHERRAASACRLRRPAPRGRCR